MGLTGYIVLRKYPANTVRLRDYMADRVEYSQYSQASRFRTHVLFEIPVISAVFSAVPEFFRQAVRLHHEYFRLITGYSLSFVQFCFTV